MGTRTKAPGPPKQPWHAVSVVGGSGVCPAIGGLRDKRFLGNEAPPLPLPECSSPWRCECIYVHFPDRRTNLRRETDRGRFPRPRFGKEMRNGQGRRADDQQ